MQNKFGVYITLKVRVKNMNLSIGLFNKIRKKKLDRVNKRFSIRTYLKFCLLTIHANVSVRN